MNRRAFAVVLLLLLAIAPAAAQYEEDEQTTDHEAQDRLYLERLERQRAEAAKQAESGDSPQEAFLARVDELIRDRNYDSAASDGYRVQTDDPRLNPKATLRVLDAFRAYFDEFFSDRLELATFDKQSRVFLFYSFHRYSELLNGAFRRSWMRPAGHYGSGFDVIALHTDADGGPSAFPNSLVHEASHQLVEHRIYAGEDGEKWIDEGLSTYFGFTFLDEAGVFHPGRIGDKQVTLFRGRSKGRAVARERLKRFRVLMSSWDAEEQGSIAEQLLWTRDPGRFYGGNTEFNYSASWLLVHFLLHGDDGRHADAFLRYVKKDIEGDVDPDVLYAELDMSPEQLDAAWTAHVTQLKVK